MSFLLFEPKGLGMLPLVTRHPSLAFTYAVAIGLNEF